MQEPDLRALWAQGDAEAHNYYERVAPHLEEWAKQRSHDLMARLKRTTLYEMLVSVVLISAFFLYIQPGSPAFVPMVITFSALVVFSSAWYLQIIRKLRGLQGLDTVKSVSGRVDVLRRFIRNLRIYLVVVTPFAQAFGMWLYLVHTIPPEEAMPEITSSVIVAIPVGICLIFLIEHLYIRKLYLPILRAYEEVYAKLTQPEESKSTAGE
ncbi:MAG: hypothetical protein AAFQ98_20185 [Bacteroidota bacterium]